MSEAELKALLREAPVPGEESAERRGLALVGAAFVQRRQPQRNPLPRIALALAVATLVAALLLSPAGAAVRDWVGDVFATGVPDAEPGLTEIPGGGRLLAQTPAGPWVVQPDGSRRLLGGYRDATWSPHGYYVAATSGRTLSAIEPDGTPRWSLSARAPATDPRWSPSGFRVAYHSGRTLRVVAGDGTGDTLVAGNVAPLPPVWSPQGLDLLAYVTAGGETRIADTETGTEIASADALDGIQTLGWAPGGSLLLETSRGSLALRRLTTSKLAGDLGLGPAREVELPADATVRAAAFSPDGGALAALLGRPPGPDGAPRSEVDLLDTATRTPRRLFAVQGRLSGIAWSPDGSRLLTSWPAADQWIFIPTDGGRVRALDGIAAAFAPGRAHSSAFPRVEGWCCARPVNPLSP
jgi:WD40 repeat protein